MKLSPREIAIALRALDSQTRNDTDPVFALKLASANIGELHITPSTRILLRQAIERAAGSGRFAPKEMRAVRDLFVRLAPEAVHEVTSPAKLRPHTIQELWPWKRGHSDTTGRRT